MQFLKFVYDFSRFSFSSLFKICQRVFSTIFRGDCSVFFQKKSLDISSGIPLHYPYEVPQVLLWFLPEFFLRFLQYVLLTFLSWLFLGFLLGFVRWFFFSGIPSNMVLSETHFGILEMVYQRSPKKFVMLMRLHLLGLLLEILLGLFQELQTIAKQTKVVPSAISPSLWNLFWYVPKDFSGIPGIPEVIYMIFLEDSPKNPLKTFGNSWKFLKYFWRNFFRDSPRRHLSFLKEFFFLMGHVRRPMKKCLGNCGLERYDAASKEVLSRILSGVFCTF